VALLPLVKTDAVPIGGGQESLASLLSSLLQNALRRLCLGLFLAPVAAWFFVKVWNINLNGILNSRTLAYSKSLQIFLVNILLSVLCFALLELVPILVSPLKVLLGHHSSRLNKLADAFISAVAALIQTLFRVFIIILWWNNVIVFLIQVKSVDWRAGLGLLIFSWFFPVLNFNLPLKRRSSTDKLAAS
jgi:hypothetical protein